MSTVLWRSVPTGAQTAFSHIVLTCHSCTVFHKQPPRPLLMGIKVSSLLCDTKLQCTACDGNVSLSEGVLAATAKLLLRDTVPFSFPSAMALRSPARNGLLNFHYSEASCLQHIFISLTLKAVLFHVLDLFKCFFSFCVCCRFRCFANFPAVLFCFVFLGFLGVYILIH